MLTGLHLGSFTPSVLLRVARRTGRLAEHDLVVEEHAVTSSPSQFKSLLSGEFDVVLTSPDNVLAYRFVPSNALGMLADVKIISAIDRGLGLGLFSRAEVVSPEQLWGGVLAVDVPDSGFAFAMYALAESIGLSRDDYSVVALGSTPRRLEALLAGQCDATMLNAGNELKAVDAGCVRLKGLSDIAPDYLGTVLATVGEAVSVPVWQLATALRATADEVCSGALDDVAVEVAGEALNLSRELAQKYVLGLKDPREGLVRDGAVDRTSMEAVVALRRRYMASTVGGVDVLARALERASGLMALAT